MADVRQASASGTVRHRGVPDHEQVTTRGHRPPRAGAPPPPCRPPPGAGSGSRPGPRSGPRLEAARASTCHQSTHRPATPASSAWARAIVQASGPEVGAGHLPALLGQPRPRRRPPRSRRPASADPATSRPASATSWALGAPAPGAPGPRRTARPSPPARTARGTPRPGRPGPVEIRARCRRSRGRGRDGRGRAARVRSCSDGAPALPVMTSSLCRCGKLRAWSRDEHDRRDARGARETSVRGSKALRLERGATLSALAATTGISVSTLSRAGVRSAQDPPWSCCCRSGPGAPGAAGPSWWTRPRPGDPRVHAITPIASGTAPDDHHR